MRCIHCFVLLEQLIDLLGMRHVLVASSPGCDPGGALGIDGLEILRDLIEGDGFDVLAIKARETYFLYMALISIVVAHPLHQVEYFLGVPRPEVKLPHRS